MNRILKNILALPRRTLSSVGHLLEPAYRYQRRANRCVPRTLARDLLSRLEAVPGNTSARKCRLLFYLASISPSSGCLVEIGAFKGKSTAWLAEAARRSNRRLITIDPHLAGSEEAFNQTVARFDIASVADIHKALSHDVGKDFNQPISFLWIDGGHDYDSVRHDILDFTPHVVAEGIVVFDDYGNAKYPGVVRAVEETLMVDPRFEYLGAVKTFALFRRRARG